MPDPPRLVPLGDAAVAIVLGHEIDPATNERIHSLAAAVHAAGLPWVLDIVPAYASLAVHYDPLRTGQHEVMSTLGSLARTALEKPEAGRRTAREHVIPVRYDGVDLGAVSATTGLAPTEVAALHCARPYTVYMLGFVPGFAYLGELHPALEVERRASPRTAVPAGSVAIAGRQTAIYPLSTPGGWHIIGTTGFRPFDEGAVPPCRLAPGDRVRFVSTGIG